MPKTVGVIIGRFQVPKLHAGHEAFINSVIAKSDEVCILIGVAPKVELKNLLPYPAVREMVRAAFTTPYSKGKLQIHPLPDVPADDHEWSRYIDQFILRLYPSYSVRLWSGRDSFKPHYHGVHIVLDWFGYDGNTNGTDERNAIITGDPAASVDFRAGIIYGLGNYLKNR